MKRFLFAALAAISSCAGPRLGFAADIAFNADLVNETALALDTNYDMDLKEIDAISFVAVYDTTTLSVGIFDDGRKSTATITIASTSGVVGQTVWVGGVRFQEGTDWTAVLTASGTAKALSDAIAASSTLTSVCIATWTVGGVVFTTATTPSGTAYSLGTSSPTAAKLNGSSSAVLASSLNGLEPDVSITNDKIYIAAHGLSTGFGFYISTTAGTIPTGLTVGTTYYAIRTNNNEFKLATSKTNAGAGTAIDITALTGLGGFTMTPAARSGNPSFKWQGSNNGSTFVDLAVSSVTVSAAGSYAWDFGVLPYRYLRLKYTAPTLGGAAIQATGNGDR